MSASRRIIALSIVLLFMTPLVAHAQEEEYVDALLSPASENPVSIELKGKAIAESDVNAMSGDLQINEVAVDVDYEAKVKGQMPLTLSLNINHKDLDSSVPVDLPSRLESRSIGASAKIPMPFIDQEGYYLGIDVRPTMNTDDGEWENSAFRLPVWVYGIYKQSEQFIVVAGLAIRVDFDDTIIPFVGLLYQPNDRLSFNFASTDPTITYKLDDNWDAVFEFDYQLEEYEVSRDGEEGLILKYRSAGTGFGLKYHYDDYLAFSVSAGAEFYRKLEYEDGNGKVEPDAAPYIKGSFSILF